MTASIGKAASPGARAEPHTLIVGALALSAAAAWFVLTTGFPLALGVLAVGSTIAWFVDRYLASEPIHVASEGLLPGPGPALVLPMRRGHLPALILASASWGIGLALLAVAVARPGSPDSSGTPWVEIGALTLLLSAAVLVTRVRRPWLGFAFTPAAIQSRGLLRDDYVPWAAITEVGLLKGRARDVRLRLQVDPGQVHRSGLGPSLRPADDGAPRWILLSLGSLTVPPELVLGLAAVGHQDPAARGAFGTADSLRLAETLRVDPLFPADPPIGRWLVGRAIRIGVAFPPTLLVIGLAFYVINALTSGGSPMTLSAWAIVPIGAVFVAPFVLAPNPRNGEMVREFGGRRTLVWFGLTALWWIVGMAATILIMQVSGLQSL